MASRMSLGMPTAGWMIFRARARRSSRTCMFSGSAMTTTRESPVRSIGIRSCWRAYSSGTRASASCCTGCRVRSMMGRLSWRLSAMRDVFFGDDAFVLQVVAEALLGAARPARLRPAICSGRDQPGIDEDFAEPLDCGRCCLSGISLLTVRDGAANRRPRSRATAANCRRAEEHPPPFASRLKRSWA